jgi:hypothetical protein
MTYRDIDLQPPIGRYIMLITGGGISYYWFTAGHIVTAFQLTHKQAWKNTITHTSTHTVYWSTMLKVSHLLAGARVVQSN